MPHDSPTEDILGEPRAISARGMTDYHWERFCFLEE